MSSAISERNRRNSRFSTGPKTPGGKRWSARNSLKHGLCAKKLLVGLEEEKSFMAFEVSWMESFAPDGPLEFELVTKMIVGAWRVRRIWRLEAAAVAEYVRRFSSCGLDMPPLFALDPTQGKPINPERPDPAGRAFVEDAAGPNVVALFLRYQAANDHAFYMALTTLIELRKSRSFGVIKP